MSNLLFFFRQSRQFSPAIIHPQGEKWKCFLPPRRTPDAASGLPIGFQTPDGKASADERAAINQGRFSDEHIPAGGGLQ
jgi:hypothetical protein